MKSLKDLQNSTKKVLNLSQSISSQQLSEYVKIATGIDTKGLSDYIEDSDYQKAYDYIIKQYSQIDIVPEESEVIEETQNQLFPAKEPEKGGAMSKSSLTQEQRQAIVIAESAKLGITMTQDETINVVDSIGDDYLDFDDFIGQASDLICYIINERTQKSQQRLIENRSKVLKAIETSHNTLNAETERFKNDLNAVLGGSRNYVKSQRDALRDYIKDNGYEGKF